MWVKLQRARWRSDGLGELGTSILFGVVAGLFVTAAAVLSAYSLYQSGSNALLEQTRRELVSFARFGAQVVDPELHRTLTKPEQESSEAYARAIEPLRKLQVAHPALDFAYTVILDGKDVKFVLDPTEAGDSDGDGIDDKSHIGEVYDTPTPEMLAALKTGQATAEPHPSADRWGSFVSGYAPFFDRHHKLVGVVGVDVTADAYTARHAALDRAFLQLVFLSLLLGAGTAILTGSLRRRLLLGRQAQRRTSMVEAQRRVLQLVASPAPLGKLLSAVCREVEALAPGTWCSIWVHRPDGGTYRAVSQTASGSSNTSSSDSVREVGAQIVGTDGRQLGRVIIKVASSFVQIDEAQELANIAASLATAAIEKRKSEDELLETHRELEDARRNLERKIEERTAELHAAMNAKSTFVAELSHETRTPLGGVIGLSDLLLDTKLDEEQREYATIIRDSATHLLQLMDGLLDLARTEGGARSNDLEPMSYADEVRATVRPFRHQCTERGLGFKLQIDPDLERTVLGSPLRLRQVLTNLLTNALKYTETGTIGVEARLSSAADGEWAILEVSDSGVGIPLDLQTDVFSKFVQGTRKHGGAGLGLSITKELVSLMGGSISFTSQPSRGTTFTIRLPMAGEKSQAA